MEQLKHPDSDSFCDRNMSCFYQVLHHRPITWMTGLCYCHGHGVILFLPFFLTFDGHDLKRRLIAEWSGLQQSIVDGAVDQWSKRLRYCVETSGRHFEHLL